MGRLILAAATLAVPVLGNVMMPGAARRDFGNSNGNGPWGGGDWSGNNGDWQCASSCFDSFAPSDDATSSWCGPDPTPTFVDSVSSCLEASCSTTMPSDAWPRITSAVSQVCSIATSCDPSSTYTLTFEGGPWFAGSSASDASVTSSSKEVVVTGCPDLDDGWGFGGFGAGAGGWGGDGNGWGDHDDDGEGDQWCRDHAGDWRLRRDINDNDGKSWSCSTSTETTTFTDASGSPVVTASIRTFAVSDADTTDDNSNNPSDSPGAAAPMATGAFGMAALAGAIGAAVAVL